MINKKKTNRIGATKCLFALPIVAIMLLMNANYAFALPSNLYEKKTDEKSIDGDDTTPFTAVEQMPEFPGGMNALMEFVGENLNYPKDAADKKIEGRVIVRFVISSTGEIEDARVLRGIDPSCDAEAVRVIESMPKWIPGKQNGKNVPVYFTMPFLFRLQREPADVDTQTIQ